ncbi:trypsin-like serine protease [Pseudoalteromonas luteoviolacea]|uniref:serine protease n=1 Tax=Pseudoalteromonas luteoviolacea TaxID=43657 RepID=UPI001B3A66A6|nr:serine protease [Pseudoalteromonas luteoviolacea]MBQ4877758.1 trypsin-like serine protease [Pseudoalteromonas luteoviolacea]MBQ4906796.1 trypsin-like serine protease [Pseudoalteromonas luteoviolacea]
MSVKMKGLLLLVTVMTPVIVNAIQDIPQASNSRAVNLSPTPEQITPYIVGGGETTPFSYPFIGSLQIDGRHQCGVSFIGENRVLTAAHCITSGSFSDFMVKFEGHDLTDDSQWQTYRVHEVLWHDEYDWGYREDNDMAILKLDRPVENITPITLADKEVKESLTPGETLKVMGWGRLSHGGDAPKKLHEVDLQYVPWDVCNDKDHHDGGITESMMCAGVPDGDKSPCHGDSGGPLVVKRDGEWIQVGIVSWGIACGAPNRPGVFADVAALSMWRLGKTLEFGFDEKSRNAFKENQPSSTFTGTFRNTLSYPINITNFAIANYPDYPNLNLSNAELVEQTCANSTLGSEQECQFTVLTKDQHAYGSYLMEVEMDSPSDVYFTEFLTYYKTSEPDSDFNQHLSTPTSIGWSTGGDANWYTEATASGEPILVSGDITDQTDDPNLDEFEQKSYVMAVIDDVHIDAVSFDYLISSEFYGDHVTVFHNNKEILKDSGLKENLQSVNIDLDDGVNQIAVIYTKDSEYSAGEDKVTIHNFNTTFTNQVPTAEVAQSQIDIRSELEFTLDASDSSDPEDDKLTFTWIDLNTPQDILGQEKTITLTADKVTKDTKKVYQVTVTDEYEASSVALVTVNIAKNNAPIITLSSNTLEVTQGEKILIVSEFSDPEGDNLTYQWSQTSGTKITLPQNTQNLEFTAPNVTKSETLSLSLTVTDEFGLSSSEQIDIKVSAPQVPESQPTPPEVIESKPTPPENDNSSGGSLGFLNLCLFAILLMQSRKQAKIEL